MYLITTISELKSDEVIRMMRRDVTMVVHKHHGVLYWIFGGCFLHPIQFLQWLF